MKLTICMFLLLLTNILLSQVNSFPYAESFEQSFTTGTDVAFIPNWTGNIVAVSNRVYEGSDPRTGSNSLNVIPISSFFAEIDISLNLTGVNNPKISFYAFSKKNGSASSSRPSTLRFSTSINGGTSYLDDIQIGTETTFPNDNSTSYTQYEYELPVAATNESNVIVRITVARGSSGTGSAAELIMDDFLIEEQALPLAISSVTTPTNSSAIVTFNQDVVQATAENTSNYSINNGIAISAAALTSSNQVTLTTSTMPNSNYELTVNNVADVATNTPSSNLIGNYSFIEPIAISNVTVVDKNNLEVEFNLDVEQSSAQALLNYAVDNGLGSPSTAQRSATENNKVTLTFSNELTENNYTLTVNNVTDQSTLTTASNLTSNFSYVPLQVSAIDVNSSTEIQITYNQNVQSSNATNVSNYSIDFGIGNPTSIVQSGTNASIVVLTLGQQMVNNTYTVTIDGVTNTNGNAVAENIQSSARFETITNKREITINELFIDPSGSNQPNPLVLPNGSADEYIELFNNSNNAIDITGFDIAGGTIGNHVLGSKQYVILTATSNITDFQGFGDVVGVSSWNTLNNGGEQLILRDNLNNLVDSLTYDLNTYQDVNKSDGGWSLEQINPELICSDVNNWRASANLSGGTPGAQNSIFDTTPDTQSPNIIAVNINSNQEIQITFDEIMDASSLSGATYILNNGLTVSSITPDAPGLRSATLSLASPMVSGTIYTLTITGATDCAGNSIDQNTITYLFDNLAPVLQRIVLKDDTTLDLIFDEDLDQSIGETEQNYNIDQGIGNPSQSSLNNTNESRVRLSFSSNLLVGSNYNLSYQNLTDTLGNVISSSNLNFNFENSIDTVIVISSQLLDVHFTQSLNQVSAETISNYLVSSGVGNPITASLDGSNDQLVHLVFGNNFPQNSSISIEFENIQNTTNAFVQALNTAFIYDTDDPDISSVTVLDQNSVQVSFDEVLEETSAESVNNYSVNNGIGIPNLVTLQSDRRSVVLDFSIDFEQEVENRLTITGIADLSGNTISNNRNFNFTYDRLPPRLNSVSLRSPTVLAVEFSEEVTESIAETTTNYQVNNGIGNPTSAVRRESNTSIVDLTFNDLGNNAVNTITISNIQDLFDNSLSNSLTGTFSTLSPTFGTFTILSDTSVQIQFTKPLTQASAEEKENYGFDGGLGAKNIVQDQADPSIVTIVLTTSMVLNQDYRLVVDRLVDLDGNTINPISFDFSFDPMVNAINILNANTIVIDFNADLREVEAEIVSNFSLNQGIGNPLTAVRNTNQNNEVTLFFNNPLQESEDYILSIQNLRNVFGDIIPFSQHEFNYDVTAPQIIAVNSLDLNQISVIFNEPVDPVTARTLNHYTLNNSIGQPSNAIVSSSATNTVILTFMSNLTDATTYQLTVDRVEDTQGKAINNATFNFTYSAPIAPSFRDIVINEVYFDTELDAGLPNVEFIEVYNRGGSDILLTDFVITDKKDTAFLTNFTLPTGNYLTITTRAAETNYAAFGNALGVINFPSLSNTGEVIYLLDRSLTIVDSLSYDKSYYNDVSKENGGFTIELINPDKPCFDVTNFGASTNANGGTPGVQNSIFDNTPDTTTPILSSLTPISDTQLQLIFNEAMDVSTLTGSNFSIQGGVVISSVTINNDFGTDISLNLSSGFARGIDQTLSISNIQDCSGNILTTQAQFLLGAIPNTEELLITEIMATPSPSQGLPSREYVEIYNNSNNVIALNEVTLSDDNSNHQLGAINLQPQSYLILTSNNGAAELAPYGQVMAINSFPTLTIVDQVKLTNSLDEDIFSISYDRSFYQDENRDDGGYSIEMINLNPACYDDANWTASTASIGGTPGTQNSVFDNTPDTSPPTVVSFSVATRSQLAITFNESMDVSSLVSANFQLTNGIVISSISLQDTFGSSVLLNLTSPFGEGVLHTLTISGVTDCAGNSIAPASFNFSQGSEPGANELIITEIMANPSLVLGLPEVEYLEIFNPSGRVISLNNVVLSDATNSTTLESFNLNPGEYLILAPQSGANQFSAFGNVLGVANWPNLNNASDRLALHNSSGNEVFRVNYDQSWFRSPSKANGGYSLEMIDINYPCLEETNWIASESANGGSPGILNSTNGSNPDLMGPELVQAIAINESTIQVDFNEKLNSSGIDPTDFTANNGLSFIAIQIDENERSVLLTTSVDLIENTVYQVTADNITDCSGNLVGNNTNTVDLIVAAVASPSDILVNEILFNPRSGGVRFVEVYNNSSKHINLKGWKLSGLNNSRVISEDNLFMAPSTFITITSDGTILTGQYPNALAETFVEISSMPGLPTSSGTVSIINGNDLEIDSFSYDEGFHSSLLNDVRGISLERILFSGASNDSNNWFSASSTENFATPGYRNSQSISSNGQAGGITVNPPTFAPDLPGGNNFTTLNFNFNTPGNTLNIKIVDSDGKVVKQLTQNAIVGTEGFFTWDGTIDGGGKARVGYYMVLMEVISTEGRVSYLRNKVAIGSRF